MLNKTAELNANSNATSTSGGAARLHFTIFESTGRLSKRYWLKPDGGIDKDSGVTFATGRYRVVEIDAADPVAALAEVGRVIDGLKSNTAIGAGVPKDGSATGRITTKARLAAGDSGAIARALMHFGFPELGLLLLDGDDISGLQKILSGLYPAFADVALLTRPSASAAVVNPQTGKALKEGEHGYCLIDQPALSADCLKALLRLDWCCGSTGRLMLSQRGDTLIRGAVDASVGSAERLSYEGQTVIGKGIDRLPRVSTVGGGKGVLCAADLLAYADRHAPVERYNALVEAAKNDPEFCARRAKLQAAYRETHITEAMAQGKTREEAEAEFERTGKADKTLGVWNFRELTSTHVLYWPNGERFTVGDIQKDPATFHGRECADPVEGLSYQSKNPAIIYAQPPEIRIYSRAHGDAFGYFAPLDWPDWSKDAEFVEALRKATEDVAANDSKVIPDKPLSTVEQLARLTSVGYDQLRKKAAKVLGVRVSVLDDMVGAARAQRRQKQQTATGIPNWRERDKYGDPIPSMHNARLAITAIGVECSYDTFHNEMLFGYKDDATRHVVEHMLGEVSDDGIIALRLVLSNRFGFDPTDYHVRDGVKSLALEHCFDPVVDMLAEAQAKWDGKKRLDRAAAEYFSCEDTKLNSACMRKTLIGAVRRVRQPGCKFDTIPVLESPEGWNKSTAWLVMAGGEKNFSDESIIGKNSREVQEQLAGVWIHENAELAGMRKAEIQIVKSFASRTVDRARPAYGHFLKKQARHSIEVGTTNDSEYLLSQSGNRRFWPMRLIGTIDLAKLKRDRLQLWGEAAHYESKGESLTLPETMWALAGVEQEARRVKDPWEAALASLAPIEGELLSVWSRVHRDGGRDHVATADILEHILHIPIREQTKQAQMRVAESMKALGWNRATNGQVTIKGVRVAGYFRDVVPAHVEDLSEPAEDLRNP